MALFSTKSKKYFRPLKNVFVLIGILFGIWMIFVDANSFFIHRELNKDIDKLEQEKAYYESEIAKDRKEIEKLSTDEGIEKYGRQEYNMKKENEDIYIIEYEDSLKLKKKDD